MENRPSPLTIEERIAGGFYGLLVGDALGVPYEFHSPGNLPPTEVIDYSPPIGFQRAHDGIPPGTWSDDGAQALCLTASLLDCGRFDETDFAGRLVRWYDSGYLAVDGVVFDVGITTRQAIQNLKAGVAPLRAGPSGEYDNGNGSLMRVLPLALWHRGTDGELIADAEAQSCVTHGHMRSQVCCALYCLWARRILEGADDPWSAATQTLRDVYKDMPDAMRELECSIKPSDAPSGTGSGYVVDSLQSARMVLNAGDYGAVVRAAVKLGHDTDTTACIAGGIVGMRDGTAGIPGRWISKLRGRELCDPLLERLLNL